MNLKQLLKLALLLLSQSAVAQVPANESFNAFINRMVVEHHFTEAELRQWFNAVTIQQPILDAMAKPAEAKPWFQYREIFMTPARIEAGVEFWKQHAAVLKAVSRHYGVPAEIIIAIIGVETRYGANTGKYRVMDALSTLSFAYPKRSEFFQKELAAYLVLSREEGIDPLQLNGSYAGAMGYPQFMPSSFQTFAVDFNHDRRRDIWNDPADAIASVANYFHHHHWRKGEPVAYPVVAKGEAYPALLGHTGKPNTTVAALKRAGIKTPKALSAKTPAQLLSYDMGDHQQLWLVLDNFYVITRYNHSPLYAMAVYQLAQAIRERHAAH